MEPLAGESGKWWDTQTGHVRERISDCVGSQDVEEQKIVKMAKGYVDQVKAGGSVTEIFLFVQTNFFERGTHEMEIFDREFRQGLTVHQREELDAALAGDGEKEYRRMANERASRTGEELVRRAKGPWPGPWSK